jgi:hypothetical protein
MPGKPRWRHYNLTVSGDSIADLETAVNSNLEKRSGKWLIANKLSLNVAKTEFMGKDR